MQQSQITYVLYKCDKGNRWAVPKYSPFDIDNEPCTFSGCKQDHKKHRIEETYDPDAAQDWFLRANS